MKTLLIFLLYLSFPLSAQINKSSAKAPKTSTQKSIAVDYLKSFANTKDSDYFQITTKPNGVPWTITKDQSWITVKRTTGSGSAVGSGGGIWVVTSANLGAQRTGTITITGGIIPVTLAVTQLAGSAPTPYLRTGNLSQFASANGSSDTVHIKSNGPWSVTDLSFTNSSPKSGTGNGYITVTVTGNTGIARSGNIVISGTGVTSQNVAVSQVSGYVSTLTTDTMWQISAAANSTDWFSVRSNTTWEVYYKPSWVSLSIMSGSGDHTGAIGGVIATVQANIGAARRDSIKLRTTDLTKYKALPVHQLAGTVTYYLNVGTISNLSNVNGISDTVWIRSNRTWTATYSSWLSGPTSGTNSTNITVVAQGNTGNARTGTVTVTGFGLSPKTITVNQAAGVNVDVANYYVSPSGSNSNSGSFASPFATIQHAYDVMTPGQLCYVRGGTYTINSDYDLNFYNKSGTAGNLMKFWAYPGEQPVFECSQSYQPHWGLAMQNSNYIHLKGLEFRNFTQGSSAYLSAGIYCLWGGGAGLGASNCRFENIKCHNNGLGAVIAGDNNVFVNCDFYNNYDAYNGYQNGDGLEVYPSTTNGSIGTDTIRNCRAWGNADDGFDCSANNSSVVFEGCQSWLNGFQSDGTTHAGDGNGFKLGWTTLSETSTYKRKVHNCISFKNYTHGFSSNTIKFIIEFYNNTTWGNGYLNTSIYPAYGYYLNLGDNIAHKLRNNIALDNRVMSGTEVTGHNSNTDAGSYNTWNSGISVSTADFVSLDYSGMNAARQADGSLPVTNFLKLTTGSALRNAGTDLGFGANIGAY